MQRAREAMSHESRDMAVGLGSGKEDRRQDHEVKTHPRVSAGQAGAWDKLLDEPTVYKMLGKLKRA